MSEHKARVQAQFGVRSTVDSYAVSQVHAQGESLSLLVEATSPQADWQVLDVATGAGHTALKFAPHVAQVIATDITEGMLQKTADLAQERGLTNLKTQVADAEDLPFETNQFDLVTCRIALHHFPDPAQAFKEFARVLKPGGLLGFVDNVGIEDNTAAQAYNAYEKLRDPSHHWVHSMAQLIAMAETAGLWVQTVLRLPKEMEFHQWADRMRVSAADKATLLEMMRNISPQLAAMLTPRWVDNTMYFTLHEAFIIAKRPLA